MTAPDSPAALLGTLERRRFGSLDIVRITPGGRATTRASLFDVGVLARVWRSGVTALVPAVRSRGGDLRR